MLLQLTLQQKLSPGVRQQAGWPEEGSYQQAVVFRTQPMGVTVTHM